LFVQIPCKPCAYNICIIVKSIVQHTINKPRGNPVIAVNIADVFARRGALDPATGSDFCQKVLSRGNTGDLMQMFSDFTGMAQPDASGLLKARGLK
jgi:hypothetical protein